MYGLTGHRQQRAGYSFYTYIKLESREVSDIGGSSTAQCRHTTELLRNIDKIRYSNLLGSARPLPPFFPLFLLIYEVIPSTFSLFLS